MSIEFIPAKDLPVAEGDEVDVLCVENGELKRKEGASLGGGGGYDMVIAIDGNIYSNYNKDNISFLSGTVADVIAKLRNLEPVSIAIVTSSAEYGSYSSSEYGCYQPVTINTIPDDQVSIRFLTNYYETQASKTHHIIVKDDAGSNLVIHYGVLTE